MEAFWNYAYWQTLAINPFDSLGHVLRGLFILGSPCANYQTGDGYGTDPKTTDLFKKCNSWLGPYQPGVNAKDPTGEVKELVQGQVAKSKTNAVPAGTRHARGQAAARPAGHLQAADHAAPRGAAAAGHAQGAGHEPEAAPDPRPASAGPATAAASSCRRMCSSRFSRCRSTSRSRPCKKLQSGALGGTWRAAARRSPPSGRRSSQSSDANSQLLNFLLGR